MTITAGLSVLLSQLPPSSCLDPSNGSPHHKQLVLLFRKICILNHKQYLTHYYPPLSAFSHQKVSFMSFFTTIALSLFLFTPPTISTSPNSHSLFTLITPFHSLSHSFLTKAFSSTISQTLCTHSQTIPPPPSSFTSTH